MGEIGSGNGSGYPGSLDTNAVLEVNSPDAGKTKVRAEVPNDLAAAIIAIQTELGIDPAGSLADVKTYLQTEHDADGTHGAITPTSVATTSVTATNLDGILGANTPAAVTGTTLKANTNLQLATGAICTGIADEDNMVSNSATLLATQQSIKAYVDASAVSFKIGSFSRDVSTATGTQAVTGVGFTPRLLVLWANIGGSPAVSFGFTNGTSHGSIHNQHAFSANAWANSSTNIVTIEQGSGNQYNGAWSSFDADGFTISWTKTGSPTGTATMYYLVLD